MTVAGRYRVAHRPQFVVAAVDVLGQALGTRTALATPTCPISCVITAQNAPTARAFDPALVLQARQSEIGALVLDGRYRVGDGPLRDVPLAAGTYQAELRGEDYRPAPFPLTWPPAAARTPLDAMGQPVDVRLMPAATYPYPDLTARPFNLGPTLLRGAVYTAAGDPVAGATVSIPALPALNPPNPPWPFLTTVTGANGDWALLLPDRRRIGFPGETTAQAPVAMTIHVVWPGGAPTLDFANVPVTLGRENTVPNTALRGVVRRAGGRSVAGVRIATSVNALQSRTRADGSWALYLDPNQADVANVTVTATAPDGATASLGSLAVRQHATVVVPTITLP